MPSFFSGAFRYVRLLLLVYTYQKRNLTVPRVFKQTVDRCPDRTALIFEDKRWTFLDLEDYSNRVAHYFLRLGYKPGDCIALFMENRFGVFLTKLLSQGPTKIGCFHFSDQSTWASGWDAPR
jgi:acyl-CoA synthetase (AMP-forming)/AMP-acid ligase II